jgi:hypothetical protein
MTLVFTHYLTEMSPKKYFWGGKAWLARKVDNMVNCEPFVQKMWDP